MSTMRHVKYDRTQTILIDRIHIPCSTYVVYSDRTGNYLRRIYMKLVPGVIYNERMYERRSI